MNRYVVIGINGQRAIIDAQNLGDLERKLQEQKIIWSSIQPYVSMARAVP